MGLAAAIVTLSNQESMSMITIKGKTAVVTGAASGIGRGLALKAAREGMAVAICDIAQGGLNETEAAAKKLGATVLASVLDVSNAAQMEKFGADIAAKLPPLALVFANAGVLRQGPLLQRPLDDWRRLYDVNVFGVVNTLQVFMPRLQAQGAAAHVVITGSQASFVAYPSLGAYSSTKHALWAIADALRQDLEEAKSPIGVSLLAPGPIATAIFDATETPRDSTPPGGRPEAMHPDELADIVFRAIDKGDTIISSHDMLKPFADARFKAAMEQISKGPR